MTRSRDFSLDLSARLLSLIEADGMPERVIDAGALALKCGECLESLPYVVSGRLDVVMHLNSEGSQLVPVSFESGELAMLSTLFYRGPANVDLFAERPCRVRWLPKQALEAALESDPSLMLLLVRFLGERMREVRIRERTWLTRSVEDRVRFVLARNALDLPRREASWIFECTHEQLARRCAVSRSKLSTVLKQLEASGVLKLHRGYIEIPDQTVFAEVPTNLR